MAVTAGGRIRRLDPESERRTILQGESGGVARAFLAGFLGLAVQGFFDTTFYSSQLAPLFWIMMGVSVVSAAIERKDLAADRRPE